MERLYAYCESCPRIEELLKAYLAHASSSSRFLLLTDYTLQLYRAIPRFHRHRYTVYAARGRHLHLPLGGGVARVGGSVSCLPGGGGTCNRRELVSY